MASPSDRSARRNRCSSASTASRSLAVAGDEGVPRVPVAVDQGVADEQLAGVLRIDAAVVDLATRNDGQAEEGDPLEGLGRTPPGVPLGVAVGALDQMACGLLDPLGPDTGHGVGVEPVGLHQLGSHHPAGALLGERGAWGEHELGVAGAAVLAAFVVGQTHVGEQAGQQGAVHSVVGGPIPVDVDAQASHDLLQLAVDVLPLPGAQEVDELGFAQPAELVGAEGFSAAPGCTPREQGRPEKSDPSTLKRLWDSAA